MNQSKFKVGDLVELTEEGLRNIVLVPTDLVLHYNHPNLFHVKRVFPSDKHHDEGISLEECCDKLYNKHGELRCTGHPAINFRRVPDLERVS